MLEIQVNWDVIASIARDFMFTKNTAERKIQFQQRVASFRRGIC